MGAVRQRSPPGCGGRSLIANRRIEVSKPGMRMKR